MSSSVLYTHLSGDTSLNCSLFCGFTCDLREAVSTNCPTELEKLLQVQHSYDAVFRRDRPCEEGIERIVGNQYAVCELCYAGKNDEDEECVDEFQPGGCRVVV